MCYIFSSKEFYNLVFNSKPFDKDFLKKWNNKLCISYIGEECTPVEWAASKGYLDIVKFLVENGADITMGGNFTLRLVVSYNHICTVKYLLNTNIYSEDYVQGVIYDNAYDTDIFELLTNYRQFSHTKACR